MCSANGFSICHNRNTLVTDHIRTAEGESKYRSLLSMRGDDYSQGKSCSRATPAGHKKICSRSAHILLLILASLTIHPSPPIAVDLTPEPSLKLYQLISNLPQITVRKPRAPKPTARYLLTSGSEGQPLLIMRLRSRSRRLVEFSEPVDLSAGSFFFGVDGEDLEAVPFTRIGRPEG